jgi:hypothetical protein
MEKHKYLSNFDFILFLWSNAFFGLWMMTTPLCVSKTPLPQSSKMHLPFPHYHLKPFLPQSSKMHPPFPFYDLKPPLP